MRIAYLILHYMAGEDTIECVHSILDVSKQSEHKILVIVVDNGSTNNSFFRICKEFGNNTNVKLIHSDINLGFAKVIIWDFIMQNMNGMRTLLFS